MDLLEFIKQYSREYGYPPTQREMASHIGLGTTATCKRIKKLVQQGRIKHVKRTVRSYRVVE